VLLVWGTMASSIRTIDGFGGNSELHALNLNYWVYRPEGVLFKLATLTKKRQVGASPKECFFGAFAKDQHLCVVDCEVTGVQKAG